MKDMERMKITEKVNSARISLLLLVLCIAIVLTYSGILTEIYASITGTMDKYRDIKEQFHHMHDNIRAADMYMSKNVSLPDNVYIWDEICLYTEDAMLFLNDLCESNGMEIKKIRFYQESDVAGGADVLTSEIEFECTYECLLSFMDDIKKEGVNAAVGSVNVLELGSGRINAVTRVSFYSLD
ncbi:MAG TPA: hypothetical protein DEF04_09535 [Clostridiales bacterium]|nr:hypothetical protein [Clostridiales bacterium]